ncbi:conserved hypothetical protein [Flavobacterium sp. 9AF]|uniref:hypothetical protein n=1 Tax=Flavobacterium sp. 9AF TaxID=2653142 RepID=UPI0012F44536|nr:hypothetical protein [Flavobacterium sp. 9AF]VXB27556.1 conserved hypothetical protein [Flavobacterium sp. 9AF]
MKNVNLLNRKKNVIFQFAFLVSLIVTLLISCEKSDDNDCNGDCNPKPTAAEFEAIREDALIGMTQNFQLNVANGLTTFTSSNGVEIDINPACLSLNGNAVTGLIDIKYIEVFDGGSMLVTDKTTMGVLPTGDLAMLISGGEFYINATQNGQQLTLNCGMNLRIPTHLTNEENDMKLWNGEMDEDGNLEWREENDPTGGQGGVFLEQGANGSTYYAFFNNFGWTNVDKFYNHTGPKTQILATVPAGYNFDNSAVYLHYDGEGNALAKLDTYDATTGQFSEHYGQIPIGLACHIIFATEENGQWRYAIKPVSITANTIYNFTLGETIVGTEAQLVAAINALP